MSELKEHGEGDSKGVDCVLLYGVFVELYIIELHIEKKAGLQYIRFPGPSHGDLYAADHGKYNVLLGVDGDVVDQARPEGILEIFRGFLVVQKLDETL